MSSSANVNGANLELSPMRVTYDGVDVGGTKGGVTVGVNYKLSDLTVDQLGSTPMDAVVSGQEFMIKFALAEINKKSNWKMAFPHAKLIDDGSNQSMYFDAQVGDHLLARSKIMILHPLSKDNADLSGDYKFYKAACKSASEVKYGPEEQSVLEVELRVFPDTSVSPSRFFTFGDPSIGLVAASAAAAVAGGGNTGNGTVTSVSAGSATITETITMSCVSGGATGKFYVSGSVSGALGLATVGTPFVNSKINFTINDGATDFVAGDSFTIATTGPNYA